MSQTEESLNPLVSDSAYSTQRNTGSSRSRSSSMTMTDTCHLRRVRDKLPWRLWIVALIGLWERAAFWGITAPWQNYMEHPLRHDKSQIPGALDLGQTKATRIYCAFYIFYYVTPLLVAPLADSYLGQYTTLLISAALYCCGCTALTVSSLPSKLSQGWGLPGLIIAMALIGLGGGGFKAIMIPFIADQYTEKKPVVRTLKTGEQVVTDYQLTLQYIYNLYFWVGNVGSLSCFATVYIEKDLGFAEAYGLCLGCMILAMFMLVFGRPYYVKIPHKENVLPQATKIVTCAVRNGFKMKRADPEFQLVHRNKTVSWTSNLVDELTRGLGVCRVLFAFIVFWLCFDQMQNNLISQAGQMKTGSTPNDLVASMNQVGCIVLGPLVQEVLYPFLHKRRIYIKPITRITIGFIFITLAMLYATVVQHAIYSSAPCYNHPKACESMLGVSVAELKASRPNVWIQAPVFILFATGEIFAYTTVIEYAYSHSPKDMKALVQAINLLVAGIASALAMALAEVARDPWLTYLFGSLTAGMAVTAVIFWFLFRKDDPKPTTVTIGVSFDEPSSDMEKGINPSKKSVPTVSVSNVSSTTVDMITSPKPTHVRLPLSTDSTGSRRLSKSSELTLCWQDSHGITQAPSE